MDPKVAFKRAALYQTCKQSKILSNVNFEQSDTESLIELVNQHNSHTIRELPILVAKVTTKGALSFLVSRYPNLRNYIEPENIRVAVESDELAYLVNAPAKQHNSIIPIVLKNLALNAVGSSISRLKEDLINSTTNAATATATDERATTDRILLANSPQIPAKLGKTDERIGDFGVVEQQPFHVDLFDDMRQKQRNDDIVVVVEEKESMTTAMEIADDDGKKGEQNGICDVDDEDDEGGKKNSNDNSIVSDTDGDDDDDNSGSANNETPAVVCVENAYGKDNRVKFSIGDEKNERGIAQDENNIDNDDDDNDDNNYDNDNDSSNKKRKHSLSSIIVESNKRMRNDNATTIGATAATTATTTTSATIYEIGRDNDDLETDFMSLITSQFDVSPSTTAAATPSTTTTRQQQKSSSPKRTNKLVGNFFDTITFDDDYDMFETPSPVMKKSGNNNNDDDSGLMI